MTITDVRVALEFDLADRMRKALRASGWSPSEMADSLEVHRNAVSSWINGRNRPRARDLRKFAELTGVPLSWLENGTLDGDHPVVRPEGFEPPAYWSGADEAFWAIARRYYPLDPAGVETVTEHALEVQHRRLLAGAIHLEAQESGASA